LSLVPRDVADDIVAEAFARVLAAIREGGGPSHAFRAYLLRAVRNLAHDWLAARRRVTVIGDMDDEVDELAGRSRMTSGLGPAAETEAETRAEARLIVRAFSRLPVRRLHSTPLNCTPCPLRTASPAARATPVGTT